MSTITRSPGLRVTLFGARGPVPAGRYGLGGMSPFWVWMQIAIVIAVLAGAIIAITKLA
jgi:hypothetical protein